MGSIEKKDRKDKKEKKEKKVKDDKKVTDVVVEDIEMKDEVEVKKEKKEKKDKKEKKSKKEVKTEESGDEVKEEKKEKKEKKSKKSTEETTSDADADSSAASPQKKRKRDTDAELAIDLSLPTPPSKKQLRKMKKHGETLPTTSDEKDVPAPADGPEKEKKVVPEPGPNASQSRGQYGVWIGNLRFSTSAETLKNWLLRDPSPLTEKDITRINMPMNKSGSRGNKGFCYVDFSSAKGLAYALSLSESELDTRRVLIKDSKDFGGRPKKEAEGAGGEVKSKTAEKISMKAPTKILFVGNLPFDTTDDDLREHFAFAGGQILRVRTARFEDSGKCKGFSFLDFDSEESVKRCLSGVAPGEELEEVEGKAGVRLEKMIRDRKMLGGKRLKLEFGEAPDVRYKKRFGGKKREFEVREGEVGGDGGEEAFARRRAMSAADAVSGARPERSFEKKTWDRPERKEWKVDARTIRPGAALAAAPRLTGGIVESKGKKMTFDD